jgi:hypothetical protein
MPPRDADLTPLGRATSPPAIRQALMVWAIRRTRNVPAAEDLVQRTLLHAYEQEETGERVWKEPIEPKEVLGHLGAVMVGFARNQWRTDGRRPIRVESPEEEASLEPDPEQAWIAYETDAERAQYEAELRKRLAADPRGAIPLAMLDWAARGVRGGKELAEKIGCTVEEAYAARTHLARVAARVMAHARGLQGKGRPS